MCYNVCNNIGQVMNILNHFQTEIYKILEKYPGRATKSQNTHIGLTEGMTVEIPQDQSRGDLTTNGAMVIASETKANPQDIAKDIAEKIKKIKFVEKVEIAYPGFINIFIEKKLWADNLKLILERGEHYGSSVSIGKNFNIEFVSANPTGPLHAAHARGAVYGDTLASLLEFTGADVIREYYVNDQGSQIETLGESVFFRYKETLGAVSGDIPENLYPGLYLKDVANNLIKEFGDKFVKATEPMPIIKFMGDYAAYQMLEIIKDDLSALGIKMNEYYKESDFSEDEIDDAFDILGFAGHISGGYQLTPYPAVLPVDENNQAKFFTSSGLSDDQDRALTKSDGTYTYFGRDIAYQSARLTKNIDRELITILGADHSGYVDRIKSAVSVLYGATDQQNNFDIELYQLVNLIKDGKRMKMSKRDGNFVTLRDLINEVGSDAIRFMMLAHKQSQTIDFDFDKVTKQSRDNPLYYVQYAHARTASVLRNAQPSNIFERTTPPEPAFDKLINEYEIALIKHLTRWPNMLHGAALAKEPHRITLYLRELASCFHTLWTAGKNDETLRFISDDKELSEARLRLVKATSNVLKLGLGILSIKPMEEMKDE